MSFYGSRKPNYSTYGSTTMLDASPSGTEISRRQASSTVIKSEYIDQAATARAMSARGGIKYVEVPVVEEVIKRVPKREIVEVEKYVPKYEHEWVERLVEVPQVQWVDRHVEVPQFQEVVKQVRRKEIVDVPREYVRHVPKIENVVVEKVVEVPGQVIEVPKPYTVEKKIPVQHYVDNEVPMVVAQTVRPVVAESDEVVEVDVYEYEPEFITVDVEVPKAVPLPIVDYGVVDETHRYVHVPPAQYNSMLRMLNSHIIEAEQSKALPFMTENGVVPFLAGAESMVDYPTPITNHIEGWTPRVPHTGRDRGVRHRGVHGASYGYQHRYSRHPADYDPYYMGHQSVYDPYALEDYYEEELLQPRAVRQRGHSRKLRSRARTQPPHSTELRHKDGRQCKCCTKV